MVSAVRLAVYFEKEADIWGGKAGENLKMLADLYKEAFVDALTNDNRAVVAVDTTCPDVTESPSLSYDKERHRHEAFHIWEYSVNPKIPGLLSESVIKADIDYAMLEGVFADYYESENTPNSIFSEAAAEVVAGAYRKAGFESRERALEFIDRFFTNVVKEYGKDSLDKLHLLRPEIKEIINDVRAREITAPGRDVRGVQEGVGEGAETDEETPRDGRAIRAANGHREWIGGNGEDQRRTGPEPGTAREQVNGHSDTEIARQPGHEINTHLYTDKNTNQTMQGRSEPTQELVAALQKIANIEAIDPTGTRSWRELAGAVDAISREAIVKAGSVESENDKELVVALEKIATLEPVDRAGARHSWKELTVTASVIASGAIEEAPSTALTMGAAGNAAEMPEPAQRSLGREPSQDQGIGW
ncbi:MAG: hypothetical protein MOB07_14080 [Acidobacteria bacterium]|nr:hypothetical protein [Acidobacteriota bacterium]